MPHRSRQLYSKRCSRKKFTPEEEAKEIHLAVRVVNPKVLAPPPPELIVLVEMEWPTTRIAELDERVVGGETLTEAEKAAARPGRYCGPRGAEAPAVHDPPRLENYFSADGARNRAPGLLFSASTNSTPAFSSARGIA